MNRYFAYYIPFFAWVKQYKWAYLHGDFVAAVTMASFYIPMALSYASNLAHVPPINGLYSFVFNPIIYALLGSCPRLVVGPEAAGSLLLGSVVREIVDKGKAGDTDDEAHARVAGLVTGLAGAIIFVAGLARLGFLDNVLSRPFMRGFISSVGVIIIVDQLLTELGLIKIASHVGGVSHGSSIDKLGFIFSHLGDVHALTCVVSAVSFGIIMVFR
jgi:MFS superfamily sulfate permease-like transporter